MGEQGQKSQIRVRTIDKFKVFPFSWNICAAAAFLIS